VSDGGTLRVLSLTQLYPGASTPTDGVFIHQRLSNLPRGVDVDVWRVRPWFPLLRGGARLPSEVVDGIRVADVPFLYIPGMLKGLDGPALLRALRRRSTDDVDVLDAHFAYPVGWAAVQFGKERGIPVVITLRGTELPYSRDPARRPRLEEAVRGADELIAVSGSLAALATDLGASPERLRVVGNGIDGGRFTLATESEKAAARDSLGIPQSAKVLLTVGGLTERKGVGRVIPAVAEMIAGGDPDLADLMYVVAGAGGPEGDDRAKLEDAARAHRIDDRVRFLGRVAHQDLTRVYHAADAFVLATRNEGWANALQESIASGLPTVATDVGGNREVLGDGAVGTLVPFGDHDALREALRSALSQPADRAAIAAFGQRRTWTMVGEETARVLRSVSDRGSKV